MSSSANALFVVHAVVLLVGFVLYTVGAALLAMPAMMSVMMFDAPGSEEVIWTQLAAFGMLVSPVVLVGAAFLAFGPLLLSAYGMAREQVTWVRVGLLGSGLILALPLLDLLAVVVGFVGLEIYCDGTFSCR